MQIKLKSNSASIVCGHVFRKERPVLLVDFDGENSPTFMCGEDDHELELGNVDGAVVGFGHLLADDPSLGEIVEIESGYEFERLYKGAPWSKSKISQSEF